MLRTACKSKSRLARRGDSVLTRAVRHIVQVQGARMLREEVTEADISDIISKWTGIPVSKLVASEREKLLHLDAELHRRVIGQDEAVQAVADAIQRCAEEDVVLACMNTSMRTLFVFSQYGHRGECFLYESAFFPSRGEPGEKRVGTLAVQLPLACVISSLQVKS